MNYRFPPRFPPLPRPRPPDSLPSATPPLPLLAVRMAFRTFNTSSLCVDSFFDFFESLAIFDMMASEFLVSLLSVGSN